MTFGAPIYVRPADMSDWEMVMDGKGLGSTPWEDPWDKRLVAGTQLQDGRFYSEVDEITLYGVPYGGPYGVRGQANGWASGKFSCGVSPILSWRLEVFWPFKARVEVRRRTDGCIAGWAASLTSRWVEQLVDLECQAFDFCIRCCPHRTRMTRVMYGDDVAS